MSEGALFDRSSLNVEDASSLTELPMPDSLCVPGSATFDNRFIGLKVSAFKTGFRVCGTDD